MQVPASLRRQGFIADQPPAASQRSFPDGADFRIEIPSVEGPRMLEAVLAEADRYDVTINRVAQGGGGLLLEESELRDMAQMGADAGLEISLFTGPKAGHDTGVTTRTADGRGHAHSVRGMRQLSYAVADILRATEAGIRGFLVADIGLLTILVEMQREGELPEETVWKISTYLSGYNPASLRVLAGMGAGTINIPSDISLGELFEMRSAVSLPIDLYLETPDDGGRIMRGHEIADFVTVGAPLYVKFGLSNAPGLYPSGRQVLDIGVASAREKVRRAAIALEWMRRDRPDAVQSKPHANGLGVPVPS